MMEQQTTTVALKETAVQELVSAHGMRNEVEGGERGPLLSRISVYSQH